MGRAVIVVLAILAAVSLVLGGYLRLREPRVPVFSNRAIVPMSILARLKHPGEKLPPEVRQEHPLVAERVLLIRDPTVVDSRDFESDPAVGDGRAAWSFASVIGAAFRTAAPEITEQNIQTKVDLWRTSLEQPETAIGTLEKAWKDYDNNFNLYRAPMRLLAIVNRSDLARLQPKGCSQPADPSSGPPARAEVRFVFGAIPPKTDPNQDAYLSMIVEFVLPCLDKGQLKGLVSEWDRLKGQDWSTGPDSPYHMALKNLLSRRVAQAESARLRITTRTDGWDVLQYAFAREGLLPQKLDRQPLEGNCHKEDSPIGGYVKNHHGEIIASNFALPDNLAVQLAIINLADASRVLTLSQGMLKPADVLDTVRFSLSVNSCVGCHGLETNTEFHHVAFRQRSAPSKLSPFLTGSKDGDLSPDKYWTATPRVMEKCGPEAAARQYNDLLRRHMFLYAVNTELTAQDTDATWQTKLDDLGLTSFQVH